MSFIAAPDSPPIQFKSSPGSSSGTEDSDSGSTDGSDNGDIPSVLPGTEITAPSNNLNEDVFEHDILAQFLVEDGDSPDPENEKADEPDYLIKSDIVDPNEISIDVVRDILSQMPAKFTKTAATATMLGMQAKRSCIVHPVWKSRKIIWERNDNIEAILMQMVGTENPVPCRRCTANRGPFTGCYSVPGIIPNGGCGCCKYNAQAAKCSLYKGLKRARAQNWRKPFKKRKHGKEAADTRDLNASYIPGAVPSPATQNGNQASTSSPAFHVVPQPRQRMLQVPIPAELGWEDAMVLRNALQEMAEQLVFAPQGNKVVRRVLREFSGALEDFASEEQD